MDSFKNESKKIFSYHTLIMAVIGLVLNISLARVVSLLNLPIFLDSVGSILVSALGGPLLGVTVGFLTNIITSIENPITLYYGVLSVFIAWIAAFFSRKGLLTKKSGCLFAAIIFMCIGGGLGSCTTWMLYGGGIGKGISAPYAYWLLDKGLPVFWAQFLADMTIDFFDKMITMFAVYIILRHLPQRICDVHPLGYIYDRTKTFNQSVEENDGCTYRKISVYHKIVIIISVSMLVLSILSIMVGVVHYKNTEIKQYEKRTVGTSRIAASLVDGDKVDDFISLKGSSYDYTITHATLTSLFNSIGDLEYLYVYKINKNDCTVVFDLDENDPDVCGEKVKFDSDFNKYKKRLLNGDKYIPIVISSSKEYGELMTSYYPIKNSMGKTVAYACADVEIENYYKGILIYIIKIVTVQFGLYIILSFWVIWFAKNKIVEPINSVVQQALDFDSEDVEKWLKSKKWLNRREIKTGDEIEVLYKTICKVEENVAHNVIHMKETERQLIQSKVLEVKNKELAAAVKKADEANTAKTDFYSRMSHDMRTPMNGIIGLVGLSEGENDIEVLHENIRKMGNAGEYLLGLINDTLDISKLEQRKMTLNFETVYAKDFLKGLLDIQINVMNEKKIKFEYDNQGIRLDMYFRVDKLRLKQVFMNLTSNAIKFTPDKGTIKFTLINRGESNGMVYDRFVLEDTGVGMSKEFIENNLYKPFSQENNSMTSQYAGTGLGLSIVKNLVDLMGGSLKVESELGKGTTFYLDLDFEEVEKNKAIKEMDKKKKETDEFDKLKELHVLLCEDHPLNTEIAVRILNKVGVTVDTASDGEIGVKKYMDSPLYKYDAILMDIRMPVMDGIEATRRIRKSDRKDSKDILIVAMTANAYTEDKELTREAGMNYHIAKPIDVDELYDILLKCHKASK